MPQAWCYAHDEKPSGDVLFMRIKEAKNKKLSS